MWCGGKGWQIENMRTNMYLLDNDIQVGSTNIIAMTDIAMTKIAMTNIIMTDGGKTNPGRIPITGIMHTIHN